MVSSETGVPRAVRSALVCLGIALVAACATSTQAPGTPAMSTPTPTPKDARFEAGWIEDQFIEGVDPSMHEALRREHDPWPTHTTIFADEQIRLSGEASRPPTVEDLEDGVYQVDFALGAEGREMNCFVYDDVLDVGTVVHTTYGELAAAVEKIVVLGVRGGVEEGRPFLIADAAYRVLHAGEPSLGTVRIGAGSAWGSSLMCVLDTPGMRKTFERLLRHTLRSLQSPNAQPQLGLRYHDVYILDGGDWVAGYFRNVVTDLDVREAVWTRYSSRLYRTVEGGLEAFDHAVAEESNAGRVHTITTIATSNGEYEHSLTVTSKPDAPFSYEVQGEASGEAVSSSFEVANGLEDLAMLEARLERLVGDPGTSTTTFPIFAPLRNPREAIDTTVTKLVPPRAGYNLMYTYPDENREYLVHVNQEGRMTLAEFNLVDGLPMRLELEYSDGELR